MRHGCIVAPALIAVPMAAPPRCLLEAPAIAGPCENRVRVDSTSQSPFHPTRGASCQEERGCVLVAMQIATPRDVWSACPYIARRCYCYCAAVLFLGMWQVPTHTHKVTLPVVSTPSAYRGRAQPLDQARRLVAAAWESPSARAAMARARTCASMVARTASSRARAASARRPQSAQAFEWPSQEMATFS